MTSNQGQETKINQRGRNLLTLIRAAGDKGISRKGLTDAIRNQLDNEDELQLDLLASEGFILVEQVDIADHPDVEKIYRAIGHQDEQETFSSST